MLKRSLMTVKIRIFILLEPLVPIGTKTDA